MPLRDVRRPLTILSLTLNVFKIRRSNDKRYVAAWTTDKEPKRDVAAASKFCALRGHTDLVWYQLDRVVRSDLVAERPDDNLVCRGDCRIFIWIDCK
jgi:hypothetical protein